MKTLEERFWAKVKQQPEGCWEWTAARTSGGYGQFGIKRVMKKAHRVSFEWENGPIPEGAEVDHICRNRLCVRPSHLRLATRKQNRENLSGTSPLNMSSGVRGVYRHRNKWQARACHNGKSYTAGLHASIEEAEAAVIALRNQLFTHNNLDRQQRAS